MNNPEEKKKARHQPQNEGIRGFGHISEPAATPADGSAFPKLETPDYSSEDAPQVQLTDVQKRERGPFAMAWISLFTAIILILPDRVQPDPPSVPAFFGLVAGVGFALGISAFRSGSWRTRIVASFAICFHAMILFSALAELYDRGK